MAIVELGGGFNPLDVYTYCDRMGYIHPQLYTDLVDGATNITLGPNGPDGEVLLDICVIAGTAQGVKILVIFCPNSEQGFTDGILKAINHPLDPCAISISWGAPSQSAWSVQGRQLVDNAIQQARDHGIQVFVASGDSGASDGTSAPEVDYPSCCPNAIACGGTSLQLNTDGTIQSEVCWGYQEPNARGATGGGFTTLYPTPSYQYKLINFSQGRKTPDIAGNADPQTGYNIQVDGFPMVVGGTSAVAPLYAALCAVITSRLGEKVNNWHEVIYSQDVIMNDIVIGNNGAYSCLPGYDLCTGMGSLDGEKLLIALAKSNNISILEPVPTVHKPIFPTLPSLSWWAALLNIFKKKTPKFARKYFTKS